MNDRRFIKPAEGRDVRDPDAGNALVPAHGKGVPWSSFWQRRLNDGDIEPTTEQAVAKGELAAQKAANAIVEAAVEGEEPAAATPAPTGSNNK